MGGSERDGVVPGEKERERVSERESEREEERGREGKRRAGTAVTAPDSTRAHIHSTTVTRVHARSQHNWLWLLRVLLKH